MDFDFAEANKTNKYKLKYKKRLIINTQYSTNNETHHAINIFSYYLGDILFYLMSLRVNEKFQVLKIKFLDEQKSNAFALCLENKTTKKLTVLIVKIHKSSIGTKIDLGLTENKTFKTKNSFGQLNSTLKSSKKSWLMNSNNCKNNFLFNSKNKNLTHNLEKTQLKNDFKHLHKTDLTTSKTFHENDVPVNLNNKDKLKYYSLAKDKYRVKNNLIYSHQTLQNRIQNINNDTNSIINIEFTKDDENNSVSEDHKNPDFKNSIGESNIINKENRKNESLNPNINFRDLSTDHNNENHFHKTKLKDYNSNINQKNKSNLKNFSSKKLKNNFTCCFESNFLKQEKNFKSKETKILEEIVNSSSDSDNSYENELKGENNNNDESIFDLYDAEHYVFENKPENDEIKSQVNSSQQNSNYYGYLEHEKFFTKIPKKEAYEYCKDVIMTKYGIYRIDTPCIIEEENFSCQNIEIKENFIFTLVKYSFRNLKTIIIKNFKWKK